MDEDQLHSLAAAYALDALPPAERQAFEAHLPTCPACTAELAALTRTAAALAHAVAAPPPPPPGLRARVLAQVARTAQEGAPQPGGRRVPAPRRRWAGVVLAAALAGVVGLGGVGVWQHREADRARAEVRQAQAAAAGVAEVLAAPDVQLRTQPLADRATGTLAVSAREDAAVFVAHDLPALPARQTYQLWFGEDGRYRPAGLLPRSGDAQQLRLTGPVAGATVVCITVEPAGGASRPTPPVLARITLPADPTAPPPDWTPQDPF